MVQQCMAVGILWMVVFGGLWFAVSLYLGLRHDWVYWHYMRDRYYGESWLWASQVINNTESNMYAAARWCGVGFAVTTLGSVLHILYTGGAQ